MSTVDFVFRLRGNMSGELGSSVDGGGQAVTIVEVEKDGRLKLNLDGLSNILNSDAIRDKPVMVVSVAGDFRMGKSFLLNLFMRYLDRPQTTGEENWLGDKEEEIGCRFEWKGGEELVTKGISMWSKPYEVELDGKKVVILLIDTQGNFDLETERVANYKIFALSTLMSSIQLYNVSQHLQDDTFEHLQAFLTYAIICETGEKASFQCLSFVIRDWRSSQSSNLGFEAGKRYLHELAAPALRRYRDKMGREIFDDFKEVRCFILPHPGLTVHRCSDSKELFLKDIDEEFVKQVKDLAKWIFSNPDLIKQMVLGHQKKVVTGKDLYRFLQMMGKNINDEKLPVVRTMSEYMIRAECELRLKEAIQKFKDETKEISSQPHDGNFTGWEKFKNIVREAHETAKGEFTKSFGLRTPIHGEYEMKLEEEVATIKVMINVYNVEKQRITDECKKQLPRAIRVFNEIIREITEHLAMGYPPTKWTLIRDTFKEAKLKTRDQFSHVYGSGSIIYKTYLENLEETMQNTEDELADKGEENEKTFRIAKEQYNILESRYLNALKEKCDSSSILSLCTNDADLRSEHNAFLEELPLHASSGSRSQALKILDVEYKVKLRCHLENSIAERAENMKERLRGPLATYSGMGLMAGSAGTVGVGAFFTLPFAPIIAAGAAVTGTGLAIFGAWNWYRTPTKSTKQKED